MRLRSFCIVIAAITAIVFAVVAFAGDTEETTKKEVVKTEVVKKEVVKHDYIGAKKCKMCHTKDGVFDGWSATAHATAFDSLTAEQKKDKAFVKYYTTGVDAAGVVLEGVQCEACHGPGSDYKSKKVMEDLDAAVAAGLLIPDAETCKKCHHAEAPGKLGANAKTFDFEKMKAKGVHAMREKPAEK